MRDEIELRKRYLGTDWQKAAATVETTFELFVLGNVEGGERHELLANALFRVCTLDSVELRALNTFLAAFGVADMRGSIPDSPSAMVSEIINAVDRLEYWADEKESAQPMEYPEKKPASLRFI